MVWLYRSPIPEGVGQHPTSNTPFIFQNLKEGFTPNIKRMQTLARPGPMHISESGIQLINRKQPNIISDKTKKLRL